MELEDLKVKADEMGISYPKNIGAEKLQDKIDNYEEPVKTEPKKKELTAKQKMSKLVRVRVTCHDPQFKKHNGLIRAAGSTTFFVKRFVPFNRETHIEQILFDVMKASEYQWFEEKVNRATGRKYKVPRTSPAFVMEELPPLSKAEFEKLAQDQRARGTSDD